MTGLLFFLVFPSCVQDCSTQGRHRKAPMCIEVWAHPTAVYRSNFMDLHCQAYTTTLQVQMCLLASYAIASMHSMQCRCCNTKTPFPTLTHVVLCMLAQVFSMTRDQSNWYVFRHFHDNRSEQRVCLFQQCVNNILGVQCQLELHAHTGLLHENSMVCVYMRNVLTTLLVCNANWKYRHWTTLDNMSSSFHLIHAS